MITNDLFAITYNADLTEGRGHTIILGYTKTLELAKAIVADPRFSRYCCMGFQSPDDWKYSVSQKPVLIFEAVDEPFELEKQKLREQALAKLNPDERRALGLI
ncbi:hypothetical protein [Pseudomonas amygdali]|uniref:Uncharacterized protein n=2 Tax=Pseudomonas amygdali pv. lachrymans TaxID=53707 RepID=A0ABR5KTF8_PSEAV|nr:hypothetical protein [Pseudomonas amygdali]AXH59716.1 hypothetical protein PLA107_031330 [Pseudomonas amygdali pv. lachrymans str. M301315]KPC17138.1 Uncharacterized protein AC499_0340 [Pseudomonas amygdali pv. lachrymans]KPC18097.1 Uncharacterized protein AC499_1299 [Pseudomonas amygdali pv. lachrymans]RMT05952.1 hypothetical protein ALP54_03622 [Pseudomonas amygdali pv. lachrymans]